MHGLGGGVDGQLWVKDGCGKDSLGRSLLLNEDEDLEFIVGEVGIIGISGCFF